MNPPPPYDIAVKSFDQSDLKIRTQYDFLELWNQISATILYIFRKPFEPINVQPTYSKVYYLASHPCTKVPILVRGNQNEQIKTQDEISLQGLVLYYLFKELIRTQFKTLCEELKEVKTDEFISVYILKWGCVNAAMDKISAIFNYLQDHWHFHMQSNTPCFNTCFIMMSLWVEVVMFPLRDILIESIVNTVNLEKKRRSEKGLNLIRDILSFFSRFETLNRNIYNDFFSTPFSKSIEIYFETNFGSKFGTKPLVTYLDEIYEEIKKEEEFARLCLHKGTDTDVRRWIVSCTILPYQERIFDESMSWIDGEKKNLRSLGLLYSLISGFNTTCDLFCGKFSNYIWEYALNKISLVDKAKVEIDHSLLVKTEIEIFSEFESMIIETFSNKTPNSNNRIDVAMSALDIAASKFVNVNEFHSDERAVFRAPWFFVRCIHALLCQYSVNLTSGKYNFSIPFAEDNKKFSEQVRIISSLFYHIIDKENFKKLYQQYLAYRLVFTKFSYEKEDFLIKSIGRQTNADFVHKFKMMLEEARASSSAAASPCSLNPSFSTTICDYYCWPSVASLEIEPKGDDGNVVNDVNIPPLLKSFYDSLSNLRSTYLRKNTHKILHWVPLSTFANITLNPNGAGIKSPINVSVSFVQVFILSFFVNRYDKNKKIVKVSDIVQKLLLMLNNNKKDEIKLKFTEVVAGAIEPLLENKLLKFADQTKELSDDKIKSYTPEELNLMTVSFNDDFIPPTATQEQRVKQISNINKNSNGNNNNLDMFLHNTLFPSRWMGSYFHHGVLKFCPPNRLASIEKSRKFALEAFIAKIIKGKKTCRLDEITEECKKTFKTNNSNVNDPSQQHLNFIPDDIMIKEAIEVLIEKSIIERQLDDPFMFRYNP